MNHVLAQLDRSFQRYEIASNAFNSFRNRYGLGKISTNPDLRSKDNSHFIAFAEAYYTLARAWKAAHPPTLEDVLWIAANAGHSDLMVPLLNLSQVTRNCDHLQAIMMNFRQGLKHWTQLHFCAANGLSDSVQRLLNLRNIDKNAKDDDGSTALILASKKNHTDVLLLLITRGADVTVKNNVGQTALHWASVHGNIGALRILVEKGADIEGQCDRKNRALHNAAIRGNMPFVEELVLIHGVDMNAMNESGDTPLSLSLKGHGKTASTRHDEVFEFLQQQMDFKNKALAALSSTRVIEAAPNQNELRHVIAQSQ